MFWHASVLPSICLSTGGVPISHNALKHFPECYGADTGGGGYPYPIMLCNISQNAMGQTLGGYPYPIMLCNITQNSMGQTPRGGTQPGPAGGVPCQVRTGGTLLGVYPSRVPPSRVPPGPGQDRGVPCWGAQAGYHSGPGQDGGYPVRTTEGVLTTQRAVCLLRSRRRTFLFTVFWKRTLPNNFGLIARFRVANTFNFCGHYFQTNKMCHQ